MEKQGKLQIIKKSNLSVSSATTEPNQFRLKATNQKYLHDDLSLKKIFPTRRALCKCPTLRHTPLLSINRHPPLHSVDSAWIRIISPFLLFLLIEGNSGGGGSEDRDFCGGFFFFFFLKFHFGGKPHTIFPSLLVSILYNTFFLKVLLPVTGFTQMPRCQQRARRHRQRTGTTKQQQSPTSDLAQTATAKGSPQRSPSHQSSSHSSARSH